MFVYFNLIKLGGIMEYIAVVTGIKGEWGVREVQKLGYKALLISGRANDSGMNIVDKSYTIDLK